MYGVNWKLLIERLLPTFFREKLWGQWIFFLISVLRNRHSGIVPEGEVNFLTFRRNHVEDLYTNSQTIVLTYRLEEVFDPNREYEPAFRIRNFLTRDQSTIVFPGKFQREYPIIYPEGTDLVENPVIYPKAINPQTFLPEFDFEVDAPIALVDKEFEIRKFIDRYRYLGTTYRVNFVTE